MPGLPEKIPSRYCPPCGLCVSRNGSVGPSQRPTIAFTHSQTGASDRTEGSFTARSNPRKRPADHGICCRLLRKIAGWSKPDSRAPPGRMRECEIVARIRSPSARQAPTRQAAKVQNNSSHGHANPFMGRGIRKVRQQRRCHSSHPNSLQCSAKKKYRDMSAEGK